MDDYCLLNRNFLAPENGFLDCLNIIKKMTGDYLLINEHVPPAFRFSSQQLDFMIETFEAAAQPAVRSCSPGMIRTSGWTSSGKRFYPYTVEVAAGGRVELKGDSPEPLWRRSRVSRNSACTRRLEGAAGVRYLYRLV